MGVKAAAAPPPEVFGESIIKDPYRWLKGWASIVDKYPIDDKLDADLLLRDHSFWARPGPRAIAVEPGLADRTSVNSYLNDHSEGLKALDKIKTLKDKINYLTGSIADIKEKHQEAKNTQDSLYDEQNKLESKKQYLSSKNRDLSGWINNPRLWGGVGVGLGIPLAMYGTKKLYDYATTPDSKKKNLMKSAELFHHNDRLVAPSTVYNPHTWFKDWLKSIENSDLSLSDKLRSQVLLGGRVYEKGLSPKREIQAFLRDEIRKLVDTHERGQEAVEQVPYLEQNNRHLELYHNSSKKMYDSLAEYNSYLSDKNKDIKAKNKQLDNENYDLNNWTTNPRFWTGIGIGAGIPLVAYGAKKLYDYATTPEKKKQVKVASQGPVKNPILEQLLQAKAFSDKKKFQEKQRVLRKLMSSYPEDFFVDSKLNDKFIGLTHRPTNFQLHLPATAVPQEVQSTYVK